MVITKNKILFKEYLGSYRSVPEFNYTVIDGKDYTATHGRVSATAPTMHEAIALCLNGVCQVKFIKN